MFINKYKKKFTKTISYVWILCKCRVSNGGYRRLYMDLLHPRFNLRYDFQHLIQPYKTPCITLRII